MDAQTVTALCDLMLVVIGIIGLVLMRGLILKRCV